MFQKIIIFFIFVYVAIFSGWVTNSFINSTQIQVVQIEPIGTSTKPIITEEPATTTPALTKVTQNKPTSTTIKKVEVPQVITITIPEPTPDFEKINNSAREATVNILCTTKNNNLSPISGTGILISPTGL